jgi:hypothetical protein
MRKLIVIVAASGASLLWGSAAASAQPNPNPNAPAHTGTACASVLANNPNTGPNGHISDTGGAHFFDVGVALCGLTS